jgi:protein FAM32A
MQVHMLWQTMCSYKCAPDHVLSCYCLTTLETTLVLRWCPTHHVRTRLGGSTIIQVSRSTKTLTLTSQLAMPSSDYTTAVGGGLKLKGAGVDKKKKKKRPRPTEDTTESSKTTSTDVAKRAKSPSRTPGRSLSPDAAEQSLKDAGGRRKTEAEKRHDEMRRKRLEERLKRDGVKTHKEKVEELNKYLSGLSEHHDMPKIGPG